MIIIVTGTPGSGKSYFSKRLAKKYKLTYLNLNDVIRWFGLQEGYDKKRKTTIVDEKKLAHITEEIILGNRNLVIDSHLSHYVNPKYVDRCYVMKCDLKKLRERLKKRGYSKSKIRENLDAEIFDVCLIEAKQKKHKVIIVESK